MNGSRVALALTAALAAASGLRGRGIAPIGGRNQTGRFRPLPRRRGHVTSPLPFVRGTVLQETIDPDLDGWASDDAGLFHVTTNLPAILREGRLRSREDLRRSGGQSVGLGGGPGDEAADKVSVGVSLNGALRLLDGMRLMARAVQAQVQPVDALNEFKRINRGVLATLDRYDPWDDDESSSGSRLAARYDEGVVESEREVLAAAPGPDLYEALQRYERHLMDTIRDWVDEQWVDDDVFNCESPIGFLESAHKFKRVKPEEVGLLRLAARPGALVELVPRECELRFDPEDVSLAGLWED